MVARRTILAMVLGATGTLGQPGCGPARSPDAPAQQVTRAADVAPAATCKPTVRVNGFVLDVKGPPPLVHPELDVDDDALASGTVVVPLPAPGELAAGEDLEPRRADTLPPGRQPRRWILQLTGPIRREQRQQLASAGVRIRSHLRDHALVAVMGADVAQQAEAFPFVHGITRFKPAYKVDRKLTDASGAIDRKRSTEARLHVQVDEPGDLPGVLAQVLRGKGKVLSVGRDVVSVQLRPHLIAKLARLEQVAWIEEAAELHLLNDTSSWTIQSNATDSRPVWDEGIRGEGQIVGIGDTGLDHDMCFFADPSGVPPGPGHRKVVAYDSVADDYDGNMGHGSHVAGSVAGDPSPITGSTVASGMAPGARLYVTDLTPGELNVVYAPADLGDLFIAPYLAGARLHSNSWGADVNAYDSFAWSLDRFMWEHRDFQVFFANGNAGPGTSTVGTPAVAKNVVSVGASENGAGAENLASFSSHGPSFDGRTKPTLTAPGVSVVSADSDGLRDSHNCGTVAFSGTSMATPTTAGSAALVRQYFGDGFWPFGSPSPARSMSPSAALVKAVLLNSAQGMSGDWVDGPIPSAGQGWGRVNLSNTLRFFGDTRFLEVFDVTDGLETGSAWTQSFFSSGERPLKVTLVWTDYPGDPAADAMLVNDLDLSVVGPDGATYLGNSFAGGASSVGGTADRVNVEEQVLLIGQAPGRYTIDVTALQVVFGPQPFALVVTGAAGVTSTGFIALDKGTYGGADQIRIDVSDADLDVHPGEPDSVVVEIATPHDRESVELVESGASTGVLVGVLATARGLAGPGDGILQVTEGDPVTATYLDADDGSGSPRAWTATARVDLSAPVVSGVATTALGQGGATVSWTTSERATGTVRYGPTPALGLSRTQTALTTGHSVQLQGLAEATPYFYAVESADEAGNVSIDDDRGALYRFTTLELPPSLTVHSSSSTLTYRPDTTIFGTALDPSGIASITVNGMPAGYRASDGYYDLPVELEVGDNSFTVVATDGRGNSATQAITVTRLVPPDLTITSMSAPSHGGNGAVAHVEQTICNVGGDVSPGTGILAWFLSVDASISPETDIGFPSALRYLDDIAPGECVPIAADVRLPVDPSLVGRTFYVGAYVDAADEIWEKDETNNGLAGGQILIEAPDLVVTSVSAPLGVETETAFTIPATFTNLGPGTAVGVAIGAYLSTDAVITTDDRLLASGRVGSLYPGQSFDAAFSATIPSSVPPGTYFVGAVVDLGGEVLECNETNNWLAGNQVTVSGPDLVMLAVSGPTGTSSGGSITVSTTVSNRSALGGASAFQIGIYLSTDPTITTSDIRVGTVSVSGLAPGASRSASTTLTLPASLAVGGYTLGAIADPQNVVVETDEANNALAGNVIAVGGPDLIMTSVSGPSSSLPGRTITVTSTVVASPAGSAAGPFFVGLFLSADPVITPSDRELRVLYITGLVPGAQSTATTTVTIPGDLPVGTYLLGAIADDFAVYYCDPESDVCSWVNDAVKESDETNNVALGNAIVLGNLPDLVMTSISGPVSAVAGGSLEVASTVANAGVAPASGFAVGFQISLDASFATSVIALGSRTVAPLAAGASSPAVTTLTLPGDLAVGNYFLQAFADSGRVIAEASESNNSLVASGAIAITGANPPAPTGLTATGGNGQISLTWSASPGATGYLVSRGAVAGGPFTFLANAAGTTYVDTSAGDGVTWFYVVQATNASGTSGYSAAASATTAPPAPAAPTGLTAAGGNGQVSLSWSSSAGASGYVVSRGTAAAGPFTFLANAAGTTYLDTSTGDGATWFYVVQATNASGTSGYSAPASATTTPPAPTGLVATGGSHQISLAWSASAGATGYVVSRGTAAGGPFTFLANAAGTTYVDALAGDGATWFYVVQAANASGTSGNSNVGSATTVPAAPTGLTATGGSRQIALAWTTSAGASGYVVSRGTAASGPFSFVANAAGTSHVDASTGDGATWFYVVQASNASGTSGYSAPASATTAPPAPTGLVATGGSRQVSLSWSAAAGASGYVVSRGTAASGPFSFLANAASTTHVDISAGEGATWFYAVQATNNSGTSGYSAAAGATTVPAAPGTLTATGGVRQIVLTWAPSVSATGYIVLRSPASGGPYTIIGTPATTGFSDSGLGDAATWFYVVQATNVTGTSGYSVAVSATTAAPVPAAPTGVTAVGGVRQIALAWSLSAGASSYVVLRSSSANGTYSTIATRATASFVDEGLADGVRRYYRIRATNASGTSGNSTTVNAITVPAPPTKVAAATGSKRGQIRLTWSASTGASAYTVLRGTASGGPYVQVGAPTGASFTDSGLTSGARYFYVVQARNASGASGNSAEASALAR